MSGDGTTVFFDYFETPDSPAQPRVWRLGSGDGPLAAPAGLDRPAIWSMNGSGSLRAGVAYTPGAPKTLENTHTVIWDGTGTPILGTLFQRRPLLSRDGSRLFVTGTPSDDIAMFDFTDGSNSMIARPTDTVSGSLKAASADGSVLVGNFSTGLPTDPVSSPYRRNAKGAWQRLDLPTSAVFARVDAVSADGQKSAGRTTVATVNGPLTAVIVWNGTGVETVISWPSFFTTPSITGHDARMRALIVRSTWHDGIFSTDVLTRTNVQYDTATYLARHGVIGLRRNTSLVMYAFSDDAGTALVENAYGANPPLFIVRNLAPPECGSGDCRAAHDAPGCADANCCRRVCAADPFCCDNTWDALCASGAAGLCFAQSDFNEDGRVDAADLAILLANWGAMGPTSLDGDDDTGAADLAMLLASWG